jgi:SAM-dependent methyltransferase
VGAALADGRDLAPVQVVSDYLDRNRENWASMRERQWESARRNWARAEPEWGIWGVPESELRALPRVDGADVVELGCGTAYWSAWLARSGARPVGVDLTPSQLEIARAMQVEHGLEFPLIEANAEQVPLGDASFDLALSEYGASIWCDPYRWVTEAARLLRPGGRLVMLRNSVLVMLTAPAEGPSGRELLHDYFGMHRFDWPECVEFHLGYGDWIRLLRASGFRLDDLIELRPSEDAVTHEVYDFVTADWARQWPSEEIWIATRAA